jgi:hypothetical protein
MTSHPGFDTFLPFLPDAPVTHVTTTPRQRTVAESEVATGPTRMIVGSLHQSFMPGRRDHEPGDSALRVMISPG